ncbi:MAG: nucleotidyl transferase AbiEii/AbiGii toxin family protein, partial [Trebonia sp.]
MTAFQVEVARLFFGLPASEGFLLAGGAALAAQHLTQRPTQDLDFFTSPGRGEVATARDGFEDAARERGWDVQRIHDRATFCRLLVHGPQDLLVDLALDSTPGLPATASLAGPTFAPQELAGRKVVALFDRAEARDFADVYVLSHRYDKETLLARAAEVDIGFDLAVFASMLDSVVRVHRRRNPFTHRRYRRPSHLRSDLGGGASSLISLRRLVASRYRCRLVGRCDRCGGAAEQPIERVSGLLVLIGEQMAVGVHRFDDRFVAEPGLDHLGVQAFGDQAAGVRVA